MNKKIFSGYGIDIVKRDGFFYIQYNDGSLVGKEIESKITEDEALKAQKSPKDASEIILLTQKRDGINTPKF
ncbi:MULTISPECIES: hypothetical protein [Pantoea]|jgi:hypothetical protein|uniref:Uncharacterized protein n=1 Tax=[Curtobacterium] plantarum TaxID=221276 RepID=A0ABT9T828_9GAMM|nr:MULTISPECIES: hypothetical protein [Pantoea]KJH60459.1 hypothetical protein UF13_14300 [Pantoea agglomerans]MBD8156500.1 hypothetical protein [Pantoea agglomerans]MBD8231318.1 hypothetical protein [Pantoea agglomerans]MBO0639974.1 hypothetical protein [Pantoea agglomerans]MDN4624107.1 hypothetical protein [Pantoea agglomerans]